MDLRPVFILYLLGLALGLSPACAQGAAPAPAKVEQPGAMQGLARSVGMSAKPVEPAEFVRNSRPDDLNYIPVHSKRPEAPGKLLTADELKAKEHELDSLKSSHDAIAKRPPVKVEYRPLQVPAQPKGVAPSPPAAALQAPPVKVQGPTLR
jgi:hypothetical protein